MIRRRETTRAVRWDVRLRSPDGTERSRTFHTQREAKAFDAAQRQSLAHGDWVDPRAGAASVATVSSAWLRSNPAKRAGTLARDTSALRTHVLPRVGERPVATVTTADVRKLVGVWSQAMAPRSVARVYGTLRTVMSYAVEAGHLARSPCRGIKLPAIEPRHPRIISASELKSLATAMPVEYAPMPYLGAVLGLRWGEVAGLRVQAIDDDRCTIAVVEQVCRGQVATTPPKSWAGRRVLTMPAPLMVMMRLHLMAQGLTVSPAALIFTSPAGQPLDYAHWRRRVWLPACAVANLTGLGFHDLRRANATEMVRSGVDLKTASTRLGHSDPRLTLAVYAQSTTAGDVDAAERLAACFFPAAPESRGMDAG